MINKDKDYFNKATTKDADIFLKYRKFLEDHGIIFKGKSICDIGCATGNFLSMVSSDKNCYGVDYSQHAINMCKERFPKIDDHFSRVNLNSTKQLPFDLKFDLITMFDVLEHVDNLGNLKKILNSSHKKGGLLVLTTPNANNFMRFVKRAWFTGEMDDTHVNLFTPYTVDFLLRKMGYEKISISTPYNFYFKDNWLTKNLPFGGQIFAIYKSNVVNRGNDKKNTNAKKK